MTNAATVVLLQNEIEDFDYCAKLLSDDFQIVISTTNFEEALAEVKIYKPSFFIVPLYVPYADGLFIIGQAKKYSPDTVCIMLDYARSQSLVELAIRSGADYFVHKPANYSDLCKLMKARHDGSELPSLRGMVTAESLGVTLSSANENDPFTEVQWSETQTETHEGATAAQAERKVHSENGANSESEKQNEQSNGSESAEQTALSIQESKVEEALSKLFIEIGIPANVKGFNYLRNGVMMTLKNPSYIGSVTKDLYPQIGETYNASASMVERAIRHAIDIAWSKGRADVVNNFLGIEAFSKEYKPTNSEFIALIADRILCVIAKKLL